MDGIECLSDDLENHNDQAKEILSVAKKTDAKLGSLQKCFEDMTITMNQTIQLQAQTATLQANAAEIMKTSAQNQEWMQGLITTMFKDGSKREKRQWKTWETVVIRIIEIVGAAFLIIAGLDATGLLPKP